LKLQSPLGSPSPQKAVAAGDCQERARRKLGPLLDATSAPATFLIAGAGGTLATIAVVRALPRALSNHNPPRTPPEHSGTPPP